METLLAVMIGIIYAAGVYSMLRRSIVKMVIGLTLLSHATNLLVFVSGGLTRGKTPIISQTAESLTGVFADPVPQALVLTAIVIGFGLTAFFLVLIQRAAKTVGTDDLNEMNRTDR